MITVKDIYKSFDRKTVLSGLSFSVSEKESIAFLGPNGVGKTTLLKILDGKIEADSGDIDLNNKKIIHVLQEQDVKEFETIEQYIQRIGKYEKYKVGKFLDLFDIHKKVTDSMSSLSSGEQTKIALIAVFLTDADIYILDEPTNNLDVKTTLFLEYWFDYMIRKKDKIFFITSHDRKFLQAASNRVIELGLQSIKYIDRKVKYEDFLRDRKNEKELEKKKYKEYIQKKKDLQKSSDYLKDISSDERLKKNSKVSYLKAERSQKKTLKSAKAIEKRSDMLKRVPRPIEYAPIQFINLFSAQSLSIEEKDALKITFDNLSVGYDKKPIVKNISLEIFYGDRVCITGLNGVGKTTLINAIKDTSLRLDGNLSVGEKVSYTYVIEGQKDILASDKTVIEYFIAKHKIDEEKISHVLEEAGFEKEYDFDIPISKLSPGQRIRALISLSSLDNTNLLILDEPTNHLDLDAIEALEYLLCNYPGTILLVSHDRTFLNSIKDFKIFHIENNKIQEGRLFKDYFYSTKKEFEKKIRTLNNLLSL